MKQIIKNKDLVLLDLFSGTGGFHAGLENAGFNFKQVYFSEIDKHAIANYKYNFPHAEYIGPVEKVIDSKIERPTLSLSEVHARILALPEKEKDYLEQKVVLSSKQLPQLLTTDQTFLFGKTLRELSHQIIAKTFGQLSKRLPTLAVMTSNGNLSIQHGYSLKIESASTLSDILQDPSEIGEKYFLSQRATDYLLKRLDDPRGFKPKLLVQ